VLGRLIAPWRIRVLSAVAQIVIRPDKYKSLALHGFGKGHFLGLADLKAQSTKRLNYPALCASDDPLMMWPRAMRERMAAAAWAALAKQA
jgi:hypothetical protein